MVSRKPVPQSANSNLTPNPSSPPYPVTPIATNTSEKFRMQDTRNELRSAEPESDNTNAWSGEGLDKQNDGSSESKRAGHKEIPESLRVGPPGYTPKSSQEMLRPSAATTNPYLQKQQDVQSESSASAWGGFPERPAPPANTPPPPPLPKDTPPPAEQFANLAVSEPSNNPWQPALSEKAPSQQPSPIPQLQPQDSGNEVWSTAPPAREAPAAPAPLDTSQQPVLVDINEAESPAWDEDDDEEPSPAVHEMPVETVPEAQQMDEEVNAWDDNRGQNSNHIAATQFVAQEDPGQQGEGWNIVDHESALSGHQESGIVGADGTVLERHITEEHAPALPPRRSQEQAPPQPPRPTLDTANASTSSLLSGTPASAIRKQKKETYEIKKITWHDVTAAENPRVSPILVQNANGPCPLLALVNALTLSTPANVETALVETLRSREQVSLGLLLDAVFDELMSGRRGDAAQELPDVSDLYSFLITLHTGMNVNPRFFPPVPSNKRYSNDPRNSMSHIHPTERDSSIPGTFEDTREMKLYSTFSIPLIHGWLPEQDSPEYAALSRSAKSFEDAQNLMFHEEELEDKLQREGLSFEEQATLEDIATIKSFFNTAATQLTPYGLETITNSLAPGAIAILFRNDHFSTLYRHPDTLQLLQLVTDMGYAGHEEVVWESLTDVNGENAEFFSGDFRLVGGAPQPPAASQPQSQSDGGGWTNVTGRRTSSLQNQTQEAANTSSPQRAEPIQGTPQSPNTEQEDHDLALALQLQEEEEERHRNEIARRRRETELSQQYIEQQGASSPSGGNIPVNVRGGGRGRDTRGSQRGASGPARGASELRPAIPPRRSGPGAGGQPIDPEAGVDAPPPSYEQAANQAAYVPPADHPAHPNASPNTQGQMPGRGRRMSAYSANAQGFAGLGPNTPRLNRTGTGPEIIGRRQSQGLSQQQQSDRERDCVIM